MSFAIQRLSQKSIVHYISYLEAVKTILGVIKSHWWWQLRNLVSGAHYFFTSGPKCPLPEKYNTSNKLKVVFIFIYFLAI